jgi:hypothetical protein
MIRAVVALKMVSVHEFFACDELSWDSLVDWVFR